MTFLIIDNKHIVCYSWVNTRYVFLQKPYPLIRFSEKNCDINWKLEHPCTSEAFIKKVGWKTFCHELTKFKLRERVCVCAGAKASDRNGKNPLLTAGVNVICVHAVGHEKIILMLNEVYKRKMVLLSFMFACCC